MDGPRFYCSYCDDYANRTPCERCGHDARSMTPVRDGYFAESDPQPHTSKEG